MSTTVNKPLYITNPDRAKEIRERDFFDTRNLRDQYKGLGHDEILAQLPTTELVAILSNNIRDFNWGTVIRNANAFAVKEVVFTLSKKYDRRATVGAHHYQKISYIPDPHDAIDHYRDLGYRIVAAEYDENYDMHWINDYQWEDKTALIFGEEGMTIPHDILTRVDDIVAIPMYGTVRSINVGTASGIFFSHYASQHVPKSS